MAFKSAAENLMDRVVKNFELKDLIKQKFIEHKNLFEICSQYPSNGVEFKVWRKTWPKDSFYILKELGFKDFAHGKAFGVLTWKGNVQNDRPVRLRNGNKRGVWKYAIANSQIKLDNGLVYTPEDMIAYDPNKTIRELEKAKKAEKK